MMPTTPVYANPAVQACVDQYMPLAELPPNRKAGRALKRLRDVVTLSHVPGAVQVSSQELGDEVAYTVHLASAVAPAPAHVVVAPLGVDGAAGATPAWFGAAIAVTAQLMAQLARMQGQLAQLAPLPGQVAQLQADVAQLAPLPGQVAQLQADVAQLAPLPGQVAQLQADVAQLAPLPGQVAQLQADVVQVQGQAAQTQGQLAQLQADVAQLAPLPGQVAQLQADVVQVQGQLVHLAPLPGQVAQIQHDVLLASVQHLNSYVRDDDPIAPILTGHPPAAPVNFPATIKHLYRLSGPQLDALLLDYGLLAVGPTEDRRKRLGQHIGLHNLL